MFTLSPEKTTKSFKKTAEIFIGQRLLKKAKSQFKKNLHRQKEEIKKTPIENDIFSIDPNAIKQIDQLLKSLTQYYLSEFEKQDNALHAEKTKEEKQKAFEAFVIAHLATLFKKKKTDIKQQSLAHTANPKHANHILEILTRFQGLIPTPHAGATALEEELTTIELALLHHFFKSLSPDFDVQVHHIAHTLATASAIWLTLNIPTTLSLQALNRLGIATSNTAAAAASMIGISCALSLVFIPVTTLIAEKLYTKSAIKAFEEKNNRKPTDSELASIQLDAKHLRYRMLGATVGWSIVLGVFQILKALHILIPHSIAIHIGIACAVGFGAAFGTCLANWHNEKSRQGKAWKTIDKTAFYQKQALLFLTTFLSAVTWYALSVLALPFGNVIGKGLAQLSHQIQLSPHLQLIFTGLANILLNLVAAFATHHLFKIGLSIIKNVTHTLPHENPLHENSLSHAAKDKNKNVAHVPPTHLLRFFGSHQPQPPKNFDQKNKSLRPSKKPRPAPISLTSPSICFSYV
jgi:hypothetical protein